MVRICWGTKDLADLRQAGGEVERGELALSPTQASADPGRVALQASGVADQERIAQLDRPDQGIHGRPDQAVEPGALLDQVGFIAHHRDQTGGPAALITHAHP